MRESKGINVGWAVIAMMLFAWSAVSWAEPDKLAGINNVEARQRDGHNPSIELRNTSVDGVAREYILFNNPNLTSSKPTRLVVVLHGFMSGHKAFMELTGFNQAAAERNDVVVIYPQGLVAKPDGWQLAGSQWDIHWGTDTDDVAFLLRIIADVKHEFSIADEHLYFTGHSNGGYMSYLMACELADRLPIAAIAPVGGTLPISVQHRCHSEHPFAVMHIHGLQDHIVDYRGIDGEALSVARSADFFAKRFGCDAVPVAQALQTPLAQSSELVRRTVYQNCQAGTAVETILIDQMGHTWPGSAIDLYKLDPYVGVTSYELNANQVILDFFSRH